METSIFLAKIIGLYMVISSLAVLINQRQIIRLVDRLFKDKIFFLFDGAIALIVGLLIVVSHNIWESDWRVIITIVGWLAVLEGVLDLFFIDTIPEFYKKFQNITWYTAISIISIAAGSYLIYQGFFV